MTGRQFCFLERSTKIRAWVHGVFLLILTLPLSTWPSNLL
jgi:hypothetical protein